MSDDGGFAVRCPGCPWNEEWRMDEQTAVKILCGDVLEAWYFQQLLATMQIVSSAKTSQNREFRKLKRFSLLLL